MAASTYFAQVQQLYIAYFGRPADTIGQAYWAAQIDAANGSIASVIAGFSASAESAALFGNKSTIDKVTAIYQNAFGRAPEPAGLAFWVAELDSGRVSQAQASWTIQQNAGPGDAAAVQNKLTAAQAFTAQLDTTAEITGYQGAAAADSARAFLKAVTADNATATAAVSGAAAAVVAATATGPTGPTFTLTNSVDVLTGTAGNDTFVGDNTQTNGSVGAGDQLNGGAGTDTFNYFVAAAGGAVVAPQLNAVENVNLIGTTTAALTADFSNAVGLQQVTLKNTTTTGSSITLGAGVAAGLDNAKFAAATFTGPASQTAATLNVVNGSNVGTVALNGAALTTLNVVSAAGAANTIGSLTSTVNETTLNVSGAGDLTINAVGATLTTINASAATGKTSIDASATTGNVAYTGGAADDTVKFGGSLTTGDVVNGGTGVNTLGVTTGASLVTGLQVTGFETLDIGGADNQTGANAYDMSKLAGITTLKVGAALNGTAAAQTTTVNNLAKGANVEINAAVGNAAADVLAINVKDAGAGSPNDTISVLVKGAAAIATTGIVDINDIETVTLTADKATATGAVTHTISDLTADEALTVKVANGNAALTITDLNAKALVLFDATEATQAVSVTTTGGTAFVATNGVAFKLGQAADTLVLTGSTTAGGDFFITGGAGGDKITLTANNGDAVADAGEEIEVLVYTAAADSQVGKTAAGATKYDVITNFDTTGAVGTAFDKIDLKALNIASGQQSVFVKAPGTAITDSGEVAAADQLNFFVNAGSKNGVAVVTAADVDGNTAAAQAGVFVYVDANGDGNFSAAGDMVIALVGATAADIGANTFVFA